MAETREEYERDSEEESAANIVYAFEGAVREDHENALKEGEDTPEIRDAVRRCIRLRNDLVDLLATLSTPREPEVGHVDAGVSSVFRVFRGDSWREATLRTVVHAAQAPYRIFRPDTDRRPPTDEDGSDLKLSCAECGHQRWLVSDEPVSSRTHPEGEVREALEGAEELARQHCDTMVERYGHMSTAVEEACKLRESVRRLLGEEGGG